MLIGGSPASTAGGLKTVTLVVMVMAIVATIRQRQQVNLGHRGLALMFVRRAAAVMGLYLGLFFVVCLALSVTEQHSGMASIDLIFEAASALGTVGLSADVTAGVSPAGRWVLIAAMFIGRIGPLGLLMGLSSRQVPAAYEYPNESVIIS